MKDLLPEFRFCVVDLETTGLDPRESEIIEVGAVSLEGGSVHRTFREYVRPDQSIPEKISRITGIRETDVQDADSAEEVLDRFSDFAGDSILVAHNVSFDLSFLNVHHQRPFSNEYIDTLRLSRELLDVPSHSLGTVAQHLEIPLENAHRALDDAHATAQLFLSLSERIQRDEDYFRCNLPRSILERTSLDPGSLLPQPGWEEDTDRRWVQWILYAVHELETRVGVNKLAKVLAGSRDQSMHKYRHLESYGALSNQTQVDLRETIKSLVEEDLLDRDSESSYPVLNLTDRGVNRLLDES